MITDFPNMTQEQMENSLEISAKFMTPTIMSAMGILATLFFGFIISLVAGMILKKNPPQL